MMAAADEIPRVAAASQFKIWGPNLYGHPKRSFEFSSTWEFGSKSAVSRYGSGFWADLDLAGGSEAT